MSEAEVRFVVRSVLQYDLAPPSGDYSSYDYGVSVGQKLDPEAVVPLIIECLIALPSGLAESFIEGVLEGATVPHLEDPLIDVVSRVREVSSAGVVVDLLVGQCGVRPTELATRLLTRMRDPTDPNQQNRLAYAVYSTFRRDTGGGATPSGSTQEGVLDCLIEEVAASATLTDYARDILNSCRRGK